jgi:hypothetical protein
LIYASVFTMNEKKRGGDINNKTVEVNNNFLKTAST